MGRGSERPAANIQQKLTHVPPPGLLHVSYTRADNAEPSAKLIAKLKRVAAAVSTLGCTVEIKITFKRQALISLTPQHLFDL